MDLRWTPVPHRPPRTGFWLVTLAGEFVDKALFVHPDSPPQVKKDNEWLSTGWYSLDYEPLEEVLAWMPVITAYTGQEEAKWPSRGRAARVGDLVTSAKVKAGRKELLRIDITGGEPLKDTLQRNDVRTAVRDLFEALCPSVVADVRVFLEKSPP